MYKFRVGDRVRVHYSSIHPSKNLYELRGYGNDEPAVVSKIDKDDSLLKYFVKFDKPLNSSDLRLWVSEDELEPLAPIPDGWTPADEPKPDARVRYAVTREGKPDGYDFDKENCYRTYDDAVTSAKKNFYDGDKQHVEVWKLVAIVNPPAEPEVVKLEETMEWVVIVESTNDIIDRFSTYEEAFAVACDFTKRYEQAVIRLEE